VNDETFDKLLLGLEPFEMPKIPGVVTSAGPANTAK